MSHSEDWETNYILFYGLVSGLGGEWVKFDLLGSEVVFSFLH